MVMIMRKTQVYQLRQHTPPQASDILVIKIILVLVLVSFQSNHFYFI